MDLESRIKRWLNCDPESIDTNDPVNQEETLTVIGGGSWGTALASVLAGNFSRVNLCDKDIELCAEIRDKHRNSKYLDDFEVPENIYPTTSIETALDGASIILIVTPSNAFREVAAEVGRLTEDNQPVVIATKGLEGNTGLLSIEIWREEQEAAGHKHFLDPLVLSGPTLALEICSGQPSVCVLAGQDLELVKAVKNKFMNPLLGITEWGDPLGVQAAAALKNVYAVACGLFSGMSWGDNITGAMIWRAAVESAAFIEALGGDPAVMSTPAGIGDLVTTCISSKSRNHHLGRMIAGKDLDDNSVRGVTEGAHTAQEAIRRCRVLELKLDLLESIWMMLAGKSQPRDVLTAVFAPIRTSHTFDGSCILGNTEVVKNKWGLPDMGVVTE